MNNANLTRISGLAAGTRAQLSDWTLTGTMPNLPAANTPVGFGATGTIFLEGDAQAGLSLRNVGLHLDTLAASLATGVGTDWTVQRYGYRIALLPNFGDSNAGADAVLESAGGITIGSGATAIAQTARAQNTAAFSLGTSGSTVRQVAGLDGDNGTAPLLADYQTIYSTVQRTHFVKADNLSPSGAMAVDSNYSVFFTSNSGSLLLHQV